MGNNAEANIVHCLERHNDNLKPMAVAYYAEIRFSCILGILIRADGRFCYPCNPKLGKYASVLVLDNTHNLKLA